MYFGTWLCRAELAWYTAGCEIESDSEAPK